jgi:carboxyl-terminal processing protease
MSRTNIPFILGSGLIVFLLGWQLGARSEQSTQWRGTNDRAVLNLSLVQEVMRQLRDHYIDPAVLEPQKLVLGAAAGLTRAVGDPYTVFMDPAENKEFVQSLEGTLKGIGAELTMEESFVKVVAPLKNSPAARAGILPGDVITAVDGQLIEGLSLADVVMRIRGREGTSVTLTIFRKNQPDPLKFTIVREAIHIPSVESRIIATDRGPVGYVALNQFGSGSINEVRAAIRSFEREKLRGLVLDLRYNGGGYLDGAVDLASLFLKKGNVVTVETRGKEKEDRPVSGAPILPDLPLVVLINQGSASASEIAAGALQDWKRATILGMKSYGKGTVQEIIDLPGGSSLRVTIAKWLTPKGRDISKQGIEPDVKVDRTKEDFEKNRDPQLDRAVEVVTGK